MERNFLNGLSAWNKEHFGEVMKLITYFKNLQVSLMWKVSYTSCIVSKKEITSKNCK